MIDADLVMRSGGRCERCGSADHSKGWSRHHRQPRGMGGTKRADVHGLHRVLLLCGSGTTGCHGHVESHRAEAYDLGYLVRKPTDPGTVPVLLHGTRWVLLGVDGSYEPVDSSPVVPPPSKGMTP